MQSTDVAINIANLRKTFAGKVAVDNISLQVGTGKIFGFLGPNGSGKTTTIRMLCGLLLPDSGSGHCLGYDIITQSYQIKLQVGYMPQRFSLYEDLTVYENLNFIAQIYGLQQRKSRIEKSLINLGLQDRKQQLVGTLSGGWKQRLALAAALLHEPKLLLLDEPTAGVDPRARRDFWDYIHKLANSGITTLVSTHYMDEAERCHHLAFIMQGKILIQGTAEQIIAATDLITYEVVGNDLTTIAEQLNKFSTALRIAAFGNTLHVSSKDATLLQQCSEKYNTVIWRKVAPSLEDVFVNLTNNNKEVIDA